MLLQDNAGVYKLRLQVLSLVIVDLAVFQEQLSSPVTTAKSLYQKIWCTVFKPRFGSRKYIFFKKNTPWRIIFWILEIKWLSVIVFPLLMNNNWSLLGEVVESLGNCCWNSCSYYSQMGHINLCHGIEHLVLTACSFNAFFGVGIVSLPPTPQAMNFLTLNHQSFKLDLK